MITLHKSIFAISPQIRHGLLSGEYQRVGGIIRDISSGRIVFLLADELNEEEDLSSLSISKPEIMGSTLGHITAGSVIKHVSLLENDLSSLNIRLRPEDLSTINEAAGLIGIDGLDEGKTLKVLEKMSKLYDHYQVIFIRYIKALDSPKDIQSFVFAKTIILVASINAKLCLLSGYTELSAEWVKRVYTDITGAIKAYCLLNSKTDRDLAHFTKIGGYPAAEFFVELREVMASPATKPKYRFPPMEAIYLWNCAEYLEGYLHELNAL